MAVKLILVVLVCVAAAAAQQSEETGGRTLDRRLNIRRFSARRKAEGERNGGRKRGNGATQEELERRKLLFSRNRLNRNRSPQATTERVESVTERRQSARTFRPRLRPVRPSNEVDVPVVRISNNDRDIQNLVLNNGQEEEEEKHFKGTSVVGTISEPSGFRSLNEQITRVSFKKPAKNDALEALLRTVAEDDAPVANNVVEQVDLSVKQKAAVQEMKEDDREQAALEARKALRGGEESEGRQRFRSFPSRAGGHADPPRRRPQGGSSSAARRDRVRSRGRGQARTTLAPVVVEEEATTLAPRLSFPAPTAAPTAPSRAEAPRSAFTLDQSFGNFFDSPLPAPAPAPAPARAPAPAPVRAPAPAPAPAQRFPQRIEPAQPAQQTFQQPAPAPQTFQPQQNFAPNPQTIQNFQQFQQSFVQQQQQQPAQRFQPAQQTFQQPQQQLQPAVQQPLQTVQAQQPAAQQSNVFAGNPFNLINSGNNFAQFDAQFGGSVPQTPGAAQLNSGIFAPQAGQRVQPFTVFNQQQQQQAGQGRSALSVFG